MTTAKFECSRESGFLKMEVKGHAGFAELGKDPVCAGASVLAMTVAQCVESMHAAGQLDKKPRTLIRNGRVSVTVKPKPSFFDAALHVFWVGQTGMLLLATAYPDNIKLEPFIASEQG